MNNNIDIGTLLMLTQSISIAIDNDIYFATKGSFFIVLKENKNDNKYLFDLKTGLVSDNWSIKQILRCFKKVETK